MDGSGRGRLLSYLKESTDPSNSSGEQAFKDSGNESMSTAARQKIDTGIDDLSTSLSSFTFSGGRGRAQLLDSLRSLDISKDQIATQSGCDSGSKAQQATTSFESSSSVLKQEKNVTQDDESNDLFCPSNIYGTKGTPTQLACNYLKLKSDPNKGVYVYEVRFSPGVDSIALRVKYLNEHRPKLGGTSTFDGQTLFLPILLEKKLTTFISKDIASQSEIEIRILFKKKESLKNCIQLYNILFDRVMKALNYVRFDRKQFDPKLPKIIPMAKLEVWPGYVTAIDEYDGGLMLCCDVSHRVLCQKTVLDMLLEIYQHNDRDFHANAKKSLLGSVVITRYNNRTYRIDDICFDQNPTSTFETSIGKLSYADYYRQHHNIQILDMKQPLLISIKKQRAKEQGGEMVFCLIPELCHLTGLRDDMRSNFKLMKEIATFTRISPNQRLLAMQKLCNNVNNSPEAKQILLNWGLSIDLSYEKTTGRRFGEESIYFANSSCLAGPNADFSRDVVKNELLHIIPLKRWILIYCKKDRKIAESFVDMMMRNTRSFGMEVLRPRMIVLDNDHVQTYVEALRRSIDEHQQIVVCICPTSRDDRYSAIKKICCAEIPIASQVINAKTLANETKNRSIVQKIALQMNCKMGGSLWAVKIPLENVMICGIDSYHDGAQKGKNSVSALVASLDATYTKWFSKAVIQTKKEEIVNGLCASFKLALEAYNRLNGKYPENVIIFRDGVGDGQLRLCSLYEIPQFEAASSNRVKITFIVVQKRINCRYYSFNGSSIDNPLPGTVIDKHITRKNMYDFFLVSQSVRQGTVSPTHFVVLRDDVNYGPDIIQRLSYKLSFLYYNWPGTVRMPACCQYAHKMAFLVGESIQREVADELSNKLFYL